jgi:sporulation related protein
MANLDYGTQYGYGDAQDAAAGYWPEQGAAPQQDIYSAQNNRTAPGGGGGGRGRLVSLAGAAVSLLLIGGLAVWGYQLVMRDVSGVPVVRALEGPMRVAPEDPGGQFASHMGLAVNAIAAVGEAEAPADRLTLAPRPLELSPEDLPMSDLQPLTLPAATEAAGSGTGENGIPGTLQGTLRTLQPSELLQTETIPAAGAASESAPHGTTPPAVSASGAETSEAAPAVPGASAQLAEAAKPVTGGLTRSSTPRLRPASLVSRSAGASDIAIGAAASILAAVTGVTEVEAATVPAGSTLVQLGAFGSRELARNAWETLALRFEDEVPGKQRVIQEARSGGKTFYRLRAMGFDDLADSRRFCATLVSANSECVPVTTR